jgi:transcription antitermination factor NusG
MGLREMFAVYSTPKKINIIKKLLNEKGLKIRETKLPEYILVKDNPSSLIPDSLKETVKVMKLENGYFGILKEANVLKDVLEADNYKKGDPVKIIDGAYKDFAGIIKEVRQNGLYKVEISVWGKIINDIVSVEEIEKTKVSI